MDVSIFYILLDMLRKYYRFNSYLYICLLSKMHISL